MKTILRKQCERVVHKCPHDVPKRSHLAILNWLEVILCKDVNSYALDSSHLATLASGSCKIDALL